MPMIALMRLTGSLGISPYFSRKFPSWLIKLFSYVDINIFSRLIDASVSSAITCPAITAPIYFFVHNNRNRRVQNIAVAKVHKRFVEPCGFDAAARIAFLAIFCRVRVFPYNRAKNPCTRCVLSRERLCSPRSKLPSPLLKPAHPGFFAIVQVEYTSYIQ